MIFTYNFPKTPFILLKIKLSPVTCHHMDNITIPLKYFGYKCFRYFYVSPKSAVFVPESAVFPTYDLEVSTFFRNFALVLRILSNTGNSLCHTLLSPITLQLPHIDLSIAHRPSPFSLYPFQRYITRVL